MVLIFFMMDLLLVRMEKSGGIRLRILRSP